MVGLLLCLVEYLRVLGSTWNQVYRMQLEMKLCQFRLLDKVTPIIERLEDLDIILPDRLISEKISLLLFAIMQN